WRCTWCLGAWLNTRNDEIAARRDIRKCKAAVAHDRCLAIAKHVVGLLAVCRHQVYMEVRRKRRSFRRYGHTSPHARRILSHEDRNAVDLLARLDGDGA